MRPLWWGRWWRFRLANFAVAQTDANDFLEAPVISGLSQPECWPGPTQLPTLPLTPISSPTPNDHLAAVDSGGHRLPRTAPHNHTVGYIHTTSSSHHSGCVGMSVLCLPSMILYPLLSPLPQLCHPCTSEQGKQAQRSMAHGHKTLRLLS